MAKKDFGDMDYSIHKEAVDAVSSFLEKREQEKAEAGRMPLIIDPEFQNKMPPLTSDERKQLEDNILNYGSIRDPLIAWNGIIVDGHNRYEIAQDNPKILYIVEHLDIEKYPDRDAAMAWMCANQLGRRNLSESQRKDLLGQQYISATKASGGQTGNKNAKKQVVQNEQVESQPKDTAEKIAAEHNVGRSTVQRSANYTKALDAAEEVSPGFRKELHAGKIKATDGEVIAILKMDKDKRKQYVEELRKGKRISKPKPQKAPAPKKQAKPTDDTALAAQAIKELCETFIARFQEIGIRKKTRAIELGAVEAIVYDLLKIMDCMDKLIMESEAQAATLV